MARWPGWWIAGAALVMVAPVPAAPIDDAVASYQRGDHAAARVAFERLAAQGVPAAAYNLAVMHLRRELPHASDRDALRWMTRSAEAGFVTAMVALAELHEQGRAGLRVDLAASVLWYRRAAEAGSVQAQLAVGTAHYLGRGAVRDAAAAARWFRLAAQGGDAGAMYLFASMAEHGEGMTRDLHEARYWYAAAARSGEVGAAEKARELEARLAQPAS